MDYDTEKPWLRQPFDTEEAFALFQEYLTLPSPRRIEKWPGARGKDVARLRWLRDEHGWPLRAAAWDDHLARIRANVVEETVATMAARHAALGMRVQALGAREVAKLTKQAESADVPVLEPRTALRYVEAGVRVEREARGLPTDGPAASAGPDYSKLTVEELRTLRELTAKAAGSV